MSIKTNVKNYTKNLNLIPLKPITKSGIFEFTSSTYSDKEKYYRIFALSDFFGDTLNSDFVSECIENQINIEVKTKIRPFGKSQSKRELQKVIDDLKKSSFGDFSDKVTSDLSQDSLDKFQDQLQEAKEKINENKLYSCLYLVRLTALDLDTLEAQTRQIYELAEDNGFVLSIVLNRQKEALEVFEIEHSKGLLSYYKYLFQENLQTLIPIKQEAKAINSNSFFIGKTMPDSQLMTVDLLQSSNDNSHFIFTGTTRAGKSTLLKSIMIQALLKDFDVIYIDPQGESSELAEVTKADLKKVGLDNGFKLLTKPDSKEDQEIYTDLITSSLVDLSKEQGFRSYYNACLYELYQSDDISLETLKKIVKKKDTEAKLNNRLVDSLVRLFEGKLGSMLAGTQEININNQFTIFDFKELQSKDHNDKLKPLFLSLFTYAISKAMHKRERKTIFIIDEAYQVLSDESSRNFIEKMIRKIGKMNGLVGIIDQSLSSYSPDFQARLLSLCANKFLFKQSDSAYLTNILDLEDIKNLQTLSKGQFLLMTESGQRYGQNIVTERLKKYLIFES